MCLPHSTKCTSHTPQSAPRPKSCSRRSPRLAPCRAMSSLATASPRTCVHSGWALSCHGDPATTRLTSGEGRRQTIPTNAQSMQSISGALEKSGTAPPHRTQAGTAPPQRTQARTAPPQRKNPNAQ
eukprot:364985-Chlamydomonas_euryale.AAC.6